MAFLVAPSEPRKLIDLLGGLTNPQIEANYGADILFDVAGKRLAGIQRKRFPADFLASLHDGRLAQQLNLLVHNVDYPLLLLEGRARWTADGNLVHTHHKFNRWRMRALCWSFAFNLGVPVTWSDNIHDTARTIRYFEKWLARPKTGTILTRSKPTLRKESLWHDDATTGQLEHFLHGLPGISQSRARAILKHYNGLPFKLEGNLRDVPGIGKKIAQEIEEFLSSRPKYLKGDQ